MHGFKARQGEKHYLYTYLADEGWRYYEQSGQAEVKEIIFVFVLAPIVENGIPNVSDQVKHEKTNGHCQKQSLKSL